jgi:hypothetical protein
MIPILPKTNYLCGLRCHKRFYLNRFHKDLANPEEELAQAIFQRGTNIGLLAHQNKLLTYEKKAKPSIDTLESIAHLCKQQDQLISDNYISLQI